MKTIKLNNIVVPLTEELRADLLAQLEKRNVRWKPEMNQYYWTIDVQGIKNESRWANDRVDNFDYSIGNVYRTEEECEQALKTGGYARLQAEQRIKDYILEKGYDTDVWDKYLYSKKYYIKYEKGMNAFMVNYAYNVLCSTLPYFKNEHQAEDTLNACKEDYKLLLGVE